MVKHARSRIDTAQPRVALVMGSDSDWAVMSEAAQILDRFHVAYTAQVLSAHRMPHDMVDFGKTAYANGIRVIIAGAGGAAHLPGMLAATTIVPVIGVPVRLRNLEGMDSLLSIVQMPTGVPVATVSIDGAQNAALLAVRILLTSEGETGSELAKQMLKYQQKLRQKAIDKGKNLQEKLEES